MSLAGLLAAVAEDPQLRSALAANPDLTVGSERDLVAPSALRPLLVAALAAGTVAPDGRGRFRPPPPGAPGAGPGGPLRVAGAPVRSVLQRIVAGLGALEPVRLVVGD